MLHSYTLWNILLCIPFYTGTLYFYTLLIEVYRTVSINYNLEQNITILVILHMVSLTFLHLK